MAVRMNVLVLRPPGNGSKAHQQFDDVIGQLLGRPGLDVTLLERLPQPGDSTTERLALESLGGHIACLAWSDAETLVGELAAAGKPMQRRVHQYDSGGMSSEDLSRAPAAGRMFYFDMRRVDANVSIFDDLQALLKTLQTPMFQIGAMKTPPPNSKRSVSPVPPTSSTTPAQPIAAPSPLPSPTPVPVPAAPIESEEDLDRLVDELDDLDL